MSTTAVSDVGFFSMQWDNITTDGFNTSVVYNAITQITTVLEGLFRTPFTIDLTAVVAIDTMQDTIDTNINMPLTNMSAEIQLSLTNQTNLISDKMNETIGVVQNETANMSNTINSTLWSFENRTYSAIEDLKEGVNDTIDASVLATEAAEEVEATAKKYSWAATVAPNPALTGDDITLSVQGQPGLRPEVDMYSWDNLAIATDQILEESGITDGLYIYEFEADSQFDVGKAYTYIVTESVTGGMVTGSGVVESMTLTAVAGLAAAAPEAESAAKKALEAIKAVEAAVVSGENINIALTLKNLKESV